jgi:hypothetical protein
MLAWRSSWSAAPSVPFPTVAVHKHRRLFVLDGVRAEHSRLTLGSGGPSYRTVALESRRLDRLLHVHEALDLASFTNIPVHVVVLRLATSETWTCAGEPLPAR